MDQNKHNMSRKLSQLIMLLQHLEKDPHTFGEGGSLTPSEIHTIDAIGEESGVLMNELAKRLQVTKGAVTQLIVRLEEKKLVERKDNPNDSRSVIVFLTEKGKSAFRAHEELHLAFYQDLSSQLDPKEIEVFETCIDKLCAYLKK